jgi:hypothetical protein
MNQQFQKGFIPIFVAAMIVALAIAMVGVGIYFKVENDKQAIKLNSNQSQVNANTSTSQKCTDYDSSQICTMQFNPGYYYNNNADGCVYDGGGCTKPYSTLKECTSACASVTVTEIGTAGIKQTCGNVIVYNLGSDGVSTASQDCQTRGGTFKECDSPCGSTLAVCRMTCTLPATNSNVAINVNAVINTNTTTNTNTINQNTNTNTTTADWQTVSYEGNSVSISMKVPAGWNVIKKTETVGVGESFITISTPNNQSLLNANVSYLSKGNFSFADWFTQHQATLATPGYYSSWQQNTVSSRDSYSFKSAKGANGTEPALNYVYQFIDAGNKIIQIYFEYPQGFTYQGADYLTFELNFLYNFKIN